jgi:2-phosphosulfolactate phosphatase
MKTIEVCFSPLLYHKKLTKPPFVAVVVDIFRASTSICAALESGVQAIIPVADLDAALAYKNRGFIVASERNGEIVDFADLGNSASEFMAETWRGSEIVFSTTNGTKVIRDASDAQAVAIGSFVNLEAVASWVLTDSLPVVVICAGWKGLFNLEDSVFAGALTEKLLNAGYTTSCDSAKAAYDLWQAAKPDLKEYLSKSSHRHRLRHLVSDEDFSYSLTIDSGDVVPVVRGDKVVCSRSSFP